MSRAHPKSNPAPEPASGTNERLPLRGWALELARRWNSGTYSLFVLHGNVFDLFPVRQGEIVEYVALKKFLVRRLFPQSACNLFYDISEVLTFGSADMQKRFFECAGDLILDELRAEATWEMTLGSSLPELERLAEEALREHRAGRTRPLDPDDL